MAIRFNLLLLLLISLGLWNIATAGDVALNGQTFKLPEGYTIELAAAPPVVERPITIDYDERGRLYVTESGGTNDRPAIQLKTTPNRVVRLEDANGDGVYDRRTVFADKMPFPEGTLWYDGSLDVAAPPSIWKLTDTNDDGVADERVEWFKGETLTNCANDLHGPYLGLDGRIYWCKGAWAEQTYPRGEGQKPFVTKAAHVFRARPDGTEIEPVVTTGMDNPVDMVFTRSGERIVSGTFVVNPAGGQRDGIFHALYGGVYGKLHGVLDGLPRTSPDMLPVLAHHGPAATCAMTRGESPVWDDAGRESLFVCLFNLRTLRRHVLEPFGATYKTIDSDLVVSDNWDFHPTDVQEDADGSLLVVDTGGWYKLCCPTSQIIKPDVLGGIYRVRKLDAKTSDDPRGLKLDWVGAKPEQIVEWLGDERFFVRRRAMHELAKRGSAIVPVLESAFQHAKSAELRTAIVWAATRIDAPAARALARGAIRDSDAGVRTVAWHSISLWRDAAQLDLSQSTQLRLEVSHESRVRAEAFGRAGKKELAELLHFVYSAPDWAGEHSFIHALIEIHDAEGLRKFIDAQTTWKHGQFRALLMALENVAPGQVKSGEVMDLLAHDDSKSKAAAAWIVGRHPEWGPEVAKELKEHPNRLVGTDLEAMLRPLTDSAEVQALVAEWLGTVERRVAAARIVAQSRLKSVPDLWVERFALLLTRADIIERAAALDLLRALAVLPLKPSQWDLIRPTLRRFAEEKRLTPDMRLAAISAWAASNAELSPNAFALLRGELAQDSSERRLAALQVMGVARLSLAQLHELAPLLAKARWQELDRWLGLFGRRDEEELRLAALASVEQSPAFATLRVEQLKQHFAKPSEKVAARLAALTQKLDAGSAERQAKLDEWLASPPASDVRRGQVVFTSAASSCMACHTVGYVGGKLGPDLTKIGAIRTERDLLESILFPSAAIVRGYDPTTIEMEDGRVLNGMIKSENATEIVLALQPPNEIKVLRREIAAIRPGTTSLMPAGLDKQLTPQQLADLVAFLKSCK